MPKKKKRKNKKLLKKCKHDYAYMHFNKRNKENVYCCCKCGKWLYI
jgi:hypothetical protein